jgi:putative membrane protein
LVNERRDGARRGREPIGACHETSNAKTSFCSCRRLRGLCRAGVGAIAARSGGVAEYAKSTGANCTAAAKRALDSGFVKAVAISDMFEIQSSKLALEKKSRGDRQFARRMIHDHGQTSEQLKRLVADGRVTAPLPTGLDGAHQQMLDQLRNDNGAEFDKAYDQMQLNGHKEAIALFESYARNGDNAALKSWAATTLPHLQEHLALAEKLSQR